MTFTQAFTVNASIASGASASIALTGGSTYTFNPSSGTELDPYVDPQGQFTQRCIKCTTPGIPNFRAYYRPDVSGGREEWVFELSNIYSVTVPVASIVQGNPTVINTTTAHGLATGFLAFFEGLNYTIRNTDGTLSTLPVTSQGGTTRVIAVTVLSPTSVSVALDSALGATKTASARLVQFDLPAYTTTITRANGTVVTPSAATNPPAQYTWTRWRWSSARRPVRTNYAALVAAKLIPPLTTGHGLTFNTLCTPVSYTPMTYAGNGGPGQGAGGVDPITGLITGWQAEYLLGRTAGLADPEASWRASAEATGTMQMTLRDPITEAFVDVSTTANKFIGWYPGSGGGITKFMYRTARNEPDGGHFPSAAYVPYLLTGDPYYLELLQVEGIYHYALSPNSAPPETRVTVKERYYAWPLRSIGQAYTATPASVPNWLCSKTYLKYLLDAARARSNIVLASTTDDGYTIFHSFWDSGQNAVPDIGLGDHAWQHAYCGVTTSWLAWLYPTEWKTIAEWLMVNEAARTSATLGWRRDHVAPYHIRFQTISALALPMTLTDTTLKLRFPDIFNPGEVVTVTNADGTNKETLTLGTVSSDGLTWTIASRPTPKTHTAPISSTLYSAVAGHNYQSWAEAGLGNALAHGWTADIDNLSGATDLTYPGILRGSMAMGLVAGLNVTGLQAGYDWLHNQIITYKPAGNITSCWDNWSIVPVP